jgi:hypothetical protein
MNWESALIRRIVAALTAAILFLTGAGPYVAHGAPPGSASGAVVQAEERPQHGLATPPVTAYLAADPAEMQNDDDDAHPDSHRPRGRTRPRRRRPWPRRGRRGKQKSSGVG